MKKRFVAVLFLVCLPFWGLFAAEQSAISPEKRALVERWLASVGEFKKVEKKTVSFVRASDGYKQQRPKFLSPITAPRVSMLVGERECSEIIFDAQSCGSSMNHSVVSRPYTRVIPKSMQEKVNLPLAAASWVMPPHIFNSPRDMQEPTTLHQAVEQSRCDVITKLLLAGANAQELDQKGRTPIAMAALNGDESVLEVLLGIADKSEAERINITSALIIQARLPVRPIRKPRKARGVFFDSTVGMICKKTSDVAKYLF